MKLKEVTFITSEKKTELIKELGIISSYFTDKPNVLIIRKNDVNYVIKNRWFNPYISNEDNAKILVDKKYIIISKLICKRLINTNAKLEMFPTDNLIIEI